MNIYAKIIEDSIWHETSPLVSSGARLTTFEIALPKVILAEFNTHRMFSRNFSSSRAIPTKTVSTLDYFEPLFWGQNQPGMQSKLEELEGESLKEAKKIWDNAVKYSRDAAEKLAALGLHKQWTNRLNDWHVMAKGIITATELDNFFELRDHEDAQPEIRMLASCMKQALNESIPTVLKHGQWHLPYVSHEERSTYGIEALVKMSSARCARVSYLTHDGKKPDMTKDFELHDRLVGSQPIHASPTEHQGTPGPEASSFYKNFRGWIQYRSFIEEGIKPTISLA